MKLQLHDKANFYAINLKCVETYNFDLKPYYDKETRIITLPEKMDSYEDYFNFADCYHGFLNLLNLVTVVE